MAARPTSCTSTIKRRPASLAQEEDDAGFAGAVVQALNLILLTSSQLQVRGGGAVVHGVWYMRAPGQTVATVHVFH